MVAGGRAWSNLCWGRDTCYPLALGLFCLLIHSLIYEFDPSRGPPDFSGFQGFVAGALPFAIWAAQRAFFPMCSGVPIYGQGHASHRAT